jgi:hypothetical protein
MNPSAIELHIERLVLSGFEGRDGPVIGEALSHELARLLTTPQASAELTENREVDRVDAGSVSMAPGSPVKTGREVARAVYRGVRQ